MNTEFEPNDKTLDIAPMALLLERVQMVWSDIFIPQYLEDEILIPEFTNRDEIQIALNNYALVEAVGNAQKDIRRWCSFHLAGNNNSEFARPDRHKYGGFLAKWIAKERPIAVLAKNFSAPPDMPQEMYRLNAFFAIAVLQSYLNNPIPHILAAELAYILHFRDEKGETIALLGYCAEEMAKPNKG
jgi:hypothetical protein